MEVMPTETLSNPESNGKRKLKNKMPKRLRRRRKESNMKIAEDTIDEKREDDCEKKTESVASSTIAIRPDSNDSTTIPIDVTSIDYWKSCTRKILEVLQKQVSHRRIFLTERHQERVTAVQYLLYQREHIEKLTEQNDSMSQMLDSLRIELRMGQEDLSIAQAKLRDHDDLLQNNDLLRTKLKLFEQKFERLTLEHNTTIEECNRRENEQIEQIQLLLDEIERIKRDLVLEEYRKQEIEKRARLFEERMKNEQNKNKKFQQDFIQIKQDLKSIHIKYDALQIEMLAMHEANCTCHDISLILPSNQTIETQCEQKQTNNCDNDESKEIQRSKRKTRDRTQSCVSTASSSSSGKRNKLATKASKMEGDINIDSSPVPKRKTMKSSKTIKKHLPTVTITQASPSTDQALLSSTGISQLLVPPSASSASDNNTTASDANDTSCESQPVPSRKKPSRYPRRHAQRPKKDLNNSDQINV